MCLPEWYGCKASWFRVRSGRRSDRVHVNEDISIRPAGAPALHRHLPSASESGFASAAKTYVVQAGPTFKLLGKNSLGEMTLSTPALTHDSLIIRTETKLYRIREGAGAASVAA